MHIKGEERKKVSVINGKLRFHLPPRVEHANRLDQQKNTEDDRAFHVFFFLCVLSCAIIKRFLSIFQT